MSWRSSNQLGAQNTQGRPCRWTSLCQSASEVTSTLTVAAHPGRSSKRPQHHAAQGTATIQPTPVNPGTGTQRTVLRALGTLSPPAHCLCGRGVLTREVSHPIAPQANGLCPAPGCPSKGESRGEIQPSRAAVSARRALPGLAPFSNSPQGTLRTGAGSLTGLHTLPLAFQLQEPAPRCPLEKPRRERTLARGKNAKGTGIFDGRSAPSPKEEREEPRAPRGFPRPPGEQRPPCCPRRPG